MDRVKQSERQAGRARLAGWLLIAASAVIFGFPQLEIGLTSLKEGPHYLSFLMLSIPIALVISLPPLLVGIGALKRRSVARWIGLVLAALGSVVFARLLGDQVRAAYENTSWSAGWPYVALWALLLVTSLVVLGALATAGLYFTSGNAGSVPAKLSHQHEGEVDSSPAGGRKLQVDSARPPHGR